MKVQQYEDVNQLSTSDFLKLHRWVTSNYQLRLEEINQRKKIAKEIDQAVAPIKKKIGQLNQDFNAELIKLQNKWGHN